jgi:hypothetical protein
MAARTLNRDSEVEYMTVNRMHKMSLQPGKGPYMTARGWGTDVESDQTAAAAAGPAPAPMI